MSIMIETKDLTFTYPAPEGETNPPALRGVSLTVEKGSFVVVLGHNGSGKSTLAKHMNAVLLPGGGAVYVAGMDTRDESLLLEIRRRTGMVFQNPDNQIVANVVEEDVAFGPENLGVPTTEIRRRVDDALAAVGMEKFARHAPHLLSGGQKQRIAIAGIIAMEPECIVLDEATAMLDPAGRREVLDTVHRLNRERGITVVLISPAFPASPRWRLFCSCQRRGYRYPAWWRAAWSFRSRLVKVSGRMSCPRSPGNLIILCFLIE